MIKEDIALGISVILLLETDNSSNLIKSEILLGNEVILFPEISNLVKLVNFSNS